MSRFTILECSNQNHRIFHLWNKFQTTKFSTISLYIFDETLRHIELCNCVITHQTYTAKSAKTFLRVHSMGTGWFWTVHGMHACDIICRYTLYIPVLLQNLTIRTISCSPFATLLEKFGGFCWIWLTTLLQSSLWRKVSSNRAKWSKI